MQQASFHEQNVLCLQIPSMACQKTLPPLLYGRLCAFPNSFRYYRYPNRMKEELEALPPDKYIAEIYNCQ